VSYLFFTWIQEQAELLAAGYEAELVKEAGQVSLEAVRNVLRKLPPHDWVSAQVRVGYTVTTRGVQWVPTIVTLALAGQPHDTAANPTRCRLSGGSAEITSKTRLTSPYV
jgi:DNA-binding FadR family transcriptional regulator